MGTQEGTLSSPRVKPTPKRDWRRSQSIGARWIEILRLAIVTNLAAFFVIWLIAPWFERPDLAPKWFLQTQKLWVECPRWALPLVLGAAFLLKCLNPSAWRFFRSPLRRLQTVLMYPRLWMGALLSTALLVWALGSWGGFAGCLGLPESIVLLIRPCVPWGILSFVVLLVAGLLTWLTFVPRHTAEPNEPAHQNGEINRPKDALSFRDFEELRNWLKDDAPVENLDQDRFGHRDIARRMARRLCAPGPLPSQAVVGPLGSGKSTLRQLVKNAIVQQGEGCHVRLVPIELWPFTTPEAAVEGVLRSLLDAFRRDISITSLRGLPRNYWEAVSAAGGLWSAMERLLRGRLDSPRGLLSHLDQAAIATGIRYVLWVEDLERFAGTSDAIDAETTEQALILAPIRALLHGLDRGHSLSVVTATTSLHARFDLEKIARFIEPLPRLPEEAAGHILDLFRRGCTMDRVDLIDPAQGSWPRREFDGELSPEGGDQPGFLMARASQLPFETLRDALLALCDTPRALKQALRRSFDFWSRSPGEIDFDHLLALNILRSCQPDVFALIQQQHGALSWSNAKPFQESEIGKTILNDSVLKHRGEKPTVDEERKRDAVEHIIVSLFGEDARNRLPQGISAKGREEEHWRRFLAEPNLLVSDQHQPLFREIRDADLDGLLGMLESMERSGDVAYFLSFLRREELGPLFARLIQRRRGENPAQWPLDASGRRVELPGLSGWLEAFRLARTREHSTGDLLWQVFSAEVDSCAAENLTLTLRLKTTLLDEFDLGLNAVHQQQALGQLHASLRRHYSGQPDRLAEALQNAIPATLNVLCGKSRSGVNDQISFNPWKGFAATILRAARRHPISMLPQLAAMTVLRDESNPNHFDRYRFDPDRAAMLFGSAGAVLALVEGRHLEEWTGVAAQLVEALFKAAQGQSQNGG